MVWPGYGLAATAILLASRSRSDRDRDDRSRRIECPMCREMSGYIGFNGRRAIFLLTAECERWRGGETAGGVGCRRHRTRGTRRLGVSGWPGRLRPLVGLATSPVSPAVLAQGDEQPRQGDLQPYLQGQEGSRGLPIQPSYLPEFIGCVSTIPTSRGRDTALPSPRCPRSWCSPPRLATVGLRYGSHLGTPTVPTIKNWSTGSAVLPEPSAFIRRMRTSS